MEEAAVATLLKSFVYPGNLVHPLQTWGNISLCKMREIL